MSRHRCPGSHITGAEVPDDAELVVDATLESIDGAVTVTGTVAVPWQAECRRCLDDIGGVLEVDVSEVFETQPVEGETYPIEGDEVDLEPVVRDAALLHLPLAPLCRPDCAGPAPDAFPADRRRRRAPTRTTAATRAGPRSTSCRFDPARRAAGGRGSTLSRDPPLGFPGCAAGLEPGGTSVPAPARPVLE